MRRAVNFCGAACLMATALLAADAPLKPPVAKVVPQKLGKHGEVRIDDYFWLKQRENPEVVKYLEAENEYTAAVMAPAKSLQETLFQEFKTRIKQTDTTVPYRRDGYYYYTRTEAGKNYPIYCRKKGSLETSEEVMLDVNQVAQGLKFCSVGNVAVSTGRDLLAYGVDSVGRRFYTLRFKNLVTGAELPDAIPDVTPNMAWANDNKTVFYTKQDPATLRSYRVYRHVLGTDVAKDTLIYEEKDDTYNCGIQKTKSKQYILIVSHHTLANEVRYLDADHPDGEFRVFLPRERGHEYSVDHLGGQFYIRTNYQAKNFRLMKTAVGSTALGDWKEVIPHRGDVLLEGFTLFKNYLEVTERERGLIHLRIIPWSGRGEHSVDFGEPAYVANPIANFELDTPLLRYSYSSMTTPDSTYDYNMATKEKKLLKRQEVLGGFDAANYRTERLEATARDGAKVPISLVYRLPFQKDSSRPLLVYGYGSYGISTDARFEPFRISLLDRGFIFAIAHVRGGEEMGRTWYEDGKLLHKKNTFTDFIDCTEYLVRQKYADPHKLFAAGGSAGGLLMGAIVTMRPELYKGIVAMVPFVDVVTTMLDDSIPLTTAEFDEWGNPNDKKYFDYILSYSPYDQTKAASYPNMLVTTGLHDSQVQYWEPAKWVAKLRALKTDNNTLILKTEMKAGHGGMTARDDRYRDQAFIYAFVLRTAGIEK